MTNLLYEQDYHLWLEKTIAQLKARDVGQLDWDNLIEELEAMGRSERKSLSSNARILLMHLLKWKYQPSKRSPSWDYTIAEHRNRIEDDLEVSPSLQSFFLESFDECYSKARKLAAKETSLPLETFPSECPFTTDEVLNSEFLPD